MATRLSNETPWAWWRRQVLAGVNHDAVLLRVSEESGWTARYVFMVLISAAISILGLLLPSSAVLIGAMLISPLMMPIIGLGFGLATFDFAEVRRASFALALGSAIAILLSIVFVSLSPLQTVTNEIAIRTRPNLFDLLVAVLSALAGGYGLIRGLGSTVVGVAIAIALMPPLAVVGFGVATSNWNAAGGAFLLFLTNLVSMAATAAFVARFYGFGSHLTPTQTRVQGLFLVAIMLALAVPLAVTLRHIAWEALASRQINDAISQRFGGDGRITDIVIDYGVDPIAVEATVLTPRIRRGAEQEAEVLLARTLKRPIQLQIEQYLVGTEDGAVQSAEIAVGRRTIARSGERIAEQLALVAGVPVDQVTVDSAHSRAIVRAATLPGATLSSYRALEARVAAAAPRWSISLIPPPLPLPQVEFEGQELTETGMRALQTAIWAAQRLAVPIGVGTTNDERAEIVIGAFSGTGATAHRVPGGGAAVDLSWLPPGDQPR